MSNWNISSLLPTRQKKNAIIANENNQTFLILVTIVYWDTAVESDNYHLSIYLNIWML